MGCCGDCSCGKTEVETSTQDIAVERSSVQPDSLTTANLDALAAGAEEHPSSIWVSERTARGWRL